MKLWLISQSQNTGCCTYDSAVVVAETAEDAVLINPEGALWGKPLDDWADEYGSWAYSPAHVRTEYIGEAAPGLTAGAVVCASYNAG